MLAGEREAECATELLEIVKDVEGEIGVKMSIVKREIPVLCLDQITSFLNTDGFMNN